MHKTRYWLGYVLAPLIVLGVMGILFFQQGLYPFGDGCITWCDMSQQYIPLLTDFKNMLAGEDGFFYSFTNGGGMNFYSVFFFFLSSPFSFLIVLVPAEKIMRFANIITMLKMGAAGASAYFYFTERAKKDKIDFWAPLLLSVMYAFCGYGLIYYQNNSWLDELYLFPILLYALDELIHNQKVCLYVIIIALSVIFNFYIGVMVALFCILYMFIFMLMAKGGLTKNDKKKISFLFIVGSGAAALISAIVWLPALLGVFDSARLSASVLDNIESANWIARLNTTLPTILSGGVAAGAIVISFIFYKDKRNGFIKRLILLLVMLIPLFIEPINILWHLGSYMSFPSRYGFMTVFIGLCVLYDAILEPPVVFEKKFWHYIIGGALVVLTATFVWYLQYLYTNNTQAFNTYINSLWGSEASLSVFGLVFGLAAFMGAVIYLAYRLGTHKLLALMLAFCVVLAQACLDLKSYMVNVDSSDEPFAGLQDLKDALPDEEDGFYRVKMRERLTYENVDGTLGDALSHYTSLTDEDTLYQMKQFGYSSYWMKLASYGGTEFSDAFFGATYEFISNNRLNKYLNEAIYEGEALKTNDHYSVMKRKYVMPMGIFANMADITTGYMDRLLFQEAFFEQLFSNEEPLFVRYEPTKEQGSYIIYEVKVEGQQILYFDAFGAYSNRLTESTNKSFAVYCNGNTIKSSYPAQAQNGILCLGLFENETVTVKIKLLSSVDFSHFSSFGLSGLKTEVLDRACQKANEAKISLTQKGSSLTGTVNVEEDKALVLSLTYDKNFTLYVDGQKQDANKIMNANGYVALSLERGEHQIVLSYVSPGFWLGLGISAFTMILVIVLWIVQKKLRMQKEFNLYRPWMGKVAQPILLVVCVLVFALIYLFPIVYKVFTLF